MLCLCILMQRAEQAVDLPHGDLQHCFIVAGKKIGRQPPTPITSMQQSLLGTGE
jgi:hypothetical protein